MKLLTNVFFLVLIAALVANGQNDDFLLGISGGGTNPGVIIDNVAGDGITVRDSLGATTDGFQALNVGDDGVYVSSAGDDSFSSSDPAGDGFFSVRAGDDGFVALDSAGDGIFISNSTGRAAFLGGDVEVMGMLTKAAGTFKIDHPLDPKNKTLSHSFVESPDMMNIYNGNVVLNEAGEATVQLPNWFTALNKDYRYQLTCIGGFAQVYIAEKVANNQFKIAGGNKNLEVSWMITGIRNDAYAKKYRTPVEEEKPLEEKGYYLQPEAFEASYQKSMEYLKRSDKLEIEKSSTE